VRIDYEDRALVQFEAIRDWYIEKAGPEAAANIVRALLDRCDSLAEFPHRGTPHDSIRPGLRRSRTSDALRLTTGSMAAW